MPEEHGIPSMHNESWTRNNMELIKADQGTC